MSEFEPPQTMIEQHIQTTTEKVTQAIANLTTEVDSDDSQLFSKLTDIMGAVDALEAQTDGLEGKLDAIQTSLGTVNANLTTMISKLTTIVTKLGGGLPSVLSSDKLKVTGLL